ncbi:hypothetical protein GQ53DRAFT_866251 [Thozetella sp. PMI_491]|nr:hypothetical protein GQ53DRAFT_866251 [Thozetella sp. PMI_491]
MPRKVDKIKVGVPSSTKVEISFTSGLFTNTPLIPKRSTPVDRHTCSKRSVRARPTKITIESSDGDHDASSSASEASDNEVEGISRRNISINSMQVETSGSESTDNDDAAKAPLSKGLRPCLKTKKGAKSCLKTRPSSKKNVVCLKKKANDSVSCLKKKNCIVVSDSDGEDTDTESSAGSPQPIVTKKAKKANKKKGAPKAGTKRSKEPDTTESGKASGRPKSKNADNSTEPESTGAEEVEEQAVTVTDNETGENNKDSDAAQAQDSAGDVADDVNTQSKRTKPDQSSGSGDWTPSQDAIILSMKKGNETWAIIGKAVGRSKKEVQKRHKELAAGTAGGQGPGNDGTNEAPSADNNSRKDQADCEKSPKQGSKNPQAAVAQDLLSFPAVDAHFALTQRQTAAFRKIYGDHYKVHTLSDKIVPDRNFSERDCEMLALLVAKTKAERWYELQAAFFNLTGRMVSVDVLKHKMSGILEDSEKE